MEAQITIRSLLIAAKEGLTLSELCNEYLLQSYEDIPYVESGYPSVEAMLEGMSDAVSRKTCPSRGLVYIGKYDV